MGCGTSRSLPPPAPTSSSPIYSEGPRKLSRKFLHISDQYRSLDQVQDALRQAGLESSNLIVGIGFTKSNEWTGKYSYQGRSLHALGDMRNPYEQATSIIGQTLAVFDEDNLIPCFGFGDASTHDEAVFSFYRDNRPCHGFHEALARYRQMVPNLKLSGPASFAPIIEAAVNTVQDSAGQHHVLAIIAEGQVTRSVDTSPGKFNSQVKATVDAIVAASDYPLSIILVGVGDGPWDMMREFENFDNFHFVNFSSIMAKNLPFPQKEALFALSAFMKTPAQYKAMVELNLLGQTGGFRSGRNPLPPPPAVLQADSEVRGYSQVGGNSAYDGAGSYQPNEQYPAQEYFPRGPPIFDESPPPSPPQKGALCALPAVMENPTQHGATVEVDRLRQTGGPSAYYGADSYQQAQEYSAGGMSVADAAPQASPRDDFFSPRSTFADDDSSSHSTSRDTNDHAQVCQICLSEPKDMAFGCGHRTCPDCGKDLQSCPFCRDKITTKIRLY